MDKVFSEKELNSILEFENKHLKCPYTKSDNTGFTIHQRWTGIGINTSISCDCCGEEQNITDYDIW